MVGLRIVVVDAWQQDEQQAKLISRLDAGQLVNGAESKQGAESWMSSSAAQRRQDPAGINSDATVGPAEEMPQAE